MALRGFVPSGRGEVSVGEFTDAIITALGKGERNAPNQNSEIIVIDRQTGMVIEQYRTPKTGRAAQELASQMQDRAEAAVVAAVEKSCEPQGNNGKDPRGRSFRSGRPITGGWGSSNGPGYGSPGGGGGRGGRGPHGPNGG
jgi:hypothetical protein